MKSTVYLAETNDRISFVRQVLEKVKVNLIQTEGMKVLVKPNIVSEELYPTTTHPEVLATVLDLLLDWQCQIMVADGPAIDAGDSARIIAHHPLAEVCAGRRLELQDVHRHGFRKVTTGSMALEISNLAFGHDLIISLPVLKPHRSCGLTGALKNQFGLLSNRERIMMHTRTKNLHRGVAELNTVVKPAFFIVDAVETYRYTNERRHGGRQVSLGYMLAGKDPVALDAYGLSLLQQVESNLANKHPEDIPHIAEALKLGLGSPDYEIEPVKLG
ncbi:MAG: DUF362 domain-containing protein [Chloroflexota bacterium]